jgi:uncharacterized protein YxeA
VENKTIKKMIIIVAVVLLLGIIASLFLNYSNSNISEIKPEIKINESGKSNDSVMNNNQNTTKAIAKY